MNAKLNAGFLRKSFCLREGPRRRSTRSVTSRLRVPASIAGPRAVFDFLGLLGRHICGQADVHADHIQAFVSP